MFKDLFTREYLLLLLISFVVVLIISGIFNALIISILITVVKYLYDKFLSTKINPLLDKLLEWIKSKIIKR